MTEEEKDLINLKISISPEKYMEELIKENQELKKQLEEKSKEISRNKTVDFINKVFKENTKFKTQQKEFIEYLTHELNTSYTNSSRFYYFSIILSKYKKIIGAEKCQK